VLAELVAPETGVILVLRDPVVVHVFEQVVAAEGFKECADVGAVVRGDEGAIGEAVCGVGRGYGVILAIEIAVLRVGAVAEVGP
jgi:hypothetical protein